MKKNCVCLRQYEAILFTHFFGMLLYSLCRNIFDKETHSVIFAKQRQRQQNNREVKLKILYLPCSCILQFSIHIFSAAFLSPNSVVCRHSTFFSFFFVTHFIFQIGIKRTDVHSYVFSTDRKTS